MIIDNTICKGGLDTHQFWRRNVEKLSGFDAKSESIWLITLSDDRHFIACEEIRSKVFRSPILFADEVLAAACLKDVEEFILFHNRPGISPMAIHEDKQRARAIILAARSKNQSLLDYMINGERDEKFIAGFFSLCHFRREFNAVDPFAPKAAKKKQRGN
jgi:RadC-like JAB domain